MSIAIRPIPAAEYDVHAPMLAQILQDAVEGGASVNFVLPFPLEEAAAYWARRRAGVMDGEVLLFGAFVDSALEGTVQLVLASQPNQPHRAEISKMLVHRRARRRGLGRALLEAAEAEARRLGRTTLVLDTAEDSAGDKLYRACGWVPFGMVEDYALNVWGKPEPAVFFKKFLT